MVRHDDEVGVSHRVVRRAHQNLGRAQLVGHHAKHLEQVLGHGSRLHQLGLVGRAAFRGRYLHRVAIPVVNRPGLEGQADLLEVVGAINALGASLGAGQSRQQHSRQNGDDGDHDEQFDQRESPSLLSLVVHLISAGFLFKRSWQTVRIPFRGDPHCQPDHILLLAATMPQHFSAFFLRNRQSWS